VGGRELIVTVGNLVSAPEKDLDVSVIEALVGRTPEEYGIPPERWAARVDFMSLTYEIFYWAMKRRKLETKEVNEVRKLTLRWGRCFLPSGFPPIRWTSKFHEFHEHLWWDLLRFLLFFFSLFFLSFFSLFFFSFFSLFFFPEKYFVFCFGMWKTGVWAWSTSSVSHHLLLFFFFVFFLSFVFFCLLTFLSDIVWTTDLQW
jgi:hypothetical protein